MPKFSNKQIYIAIGIVLFVVLIYSIVKNKDNAAQEQFGNSSDIAGQGSFATSVNPNSPTSSVIKKSTTPVKAPPAPLSATQRYLDAIRIYKNVGYYFQFVDCHGMPGTITLKKGKKFMLDNRDAETHKIAIVGGQSFSISAYNFAVATAPSAPGTYYITCDGGGAASILVQQ